MQDYLKNFDNIELSENVKILPADAEITQELEKSEILITDYSSVAYDFYYLNKPIIFFQFDKDEYDKKVGSYVKNKDLFGIQVKSVEKCVENIIKISENNFNCDKNLIEKFEKLQPKLLKYTDKKNCDRVYTEIIKHLKNK